MRRLSIVKYGVQTNIHYAPRGKNES